MPGIVNALSLVAETVSPVAEVAGTVGEGAIIPFALYFLLVSFVVALATSAIRLRDPKLIVRESARFFLTIVVGIFLFSLLVFALEWLFIRPLV